MTFNTPQEHNAWKKQQQPIIDQHLAQLDAVAHEKEVIWGGMDRLIAFAPLDVRERFNHLRRDLNTAIRATDVHTVALLVPRLIQGWQVLERAAKDLGYTPEHTGIYEDPIVNSVLRNFSGSTIDGIYDRDATAWHNEYGDLEDEVPFD